MHTSVLSPFFRLVALPLAFEVILGGMQTLPELTKFRTRVLHVQNKYEHCQSWVGVDTNFRPINDIKVAANKSFCGLPLIV